LEHVNRLLGDASLREKMSHAARLDAQEKFSATVIAKKTESVYNSLTLKREITNE